MPKHKHSELIKLWADGATIQEFYRDEENSKGVWITDEEPTWDEEGIYRIKPERKRYRVAKFPGYVVAANTDEYAAEIETIPEFIEWLGDWIEYD